MKNYKSIITILVSLLLIGILILSAIWLKKTIHHASNFRPSASILEVMNSIVDPNADFVWNSVAVITTAAGTEEKAPHTDEEWAEVRRHAITLSEATNLLLIEGRKVAPDHIDTSSVPAELKAEEVQKLIDEHSEDFVRHAHELHDAVQLAIVAIDAKIQMSWSKRVAKLTMFASNAISNSGIQMTRYLQQSRTLDLISHQR